MKAHEALIAWTSEGDGLSTQILIGPADGDQDWIDSFDCTGGAAFFARRDIRGEDSVRVLFADFIDLIVECRMDPKAVHREFMKIDEYREIVEAGTSEAVFERIMAGKLAEQ
jgi:hypothetical protein